ncbi:hypothetical protein PMAYCL1PPCAC_05618, partial [Pristionchus mayeri]
SQDSLPLWLVTRTTVSRRGREEGFQSFFPLRSSPQLLLSIDMLGIPAALAVLQEPKKPLFPLGILFIALTWTILTIRFVNLLNGDAE